MADNIRTMREPTPEGRLAAVVRDEMLRQLDARPYSRLADYADFRSALRHQVQIELLRARIEEAQLTPLNDARIAELKKELSCLLT